MTAQASRPVGTEVATEAATQAATRDALGGSLRRRLLVAAAAWIVLALLAVGVVLVALFRHHAEQ